MIHGRILNLACKFCNQINSHFLQLHTHVYILEVLGGFLIGADKEVKSNFRSSFTRVCILSFSLSQCHEVLNFC